MSLNKNWAEISSASLLAVIAISFASCSAKVDGGAGDLFSDTKKFAPGPVIAPAPKPPAAPSSPSNPASGNPAKATGLKDAKSAFCQDNQTDVVVNFGEASLSLDENGMTTGSLGTLNVGHRAHGSHDAYQVEKINYPVLMSNGPATTIIAITNDQVVRVDVKTYDFVKGEAQAKIPGRTLTTNLTCEYYSSELAL